MAEPPTVGEGPTSVVDDFGPHYLLPTAKAHGRLRRPCVGPGVLNERDGGARIFGAV